MEKETAFWEAVVTLAPLLALTLVVELRTNRWPQFHAFIRNTLITYMFICLACLFASTITAIHVLKDWGESSSNTDQNADFAILSITTAAFGAVMWPVYNALFIAQGSGVLKVRKARRASKIRRKAYRTKLSVLQSVKHEKALEACERILMNPDGVFRTTPSGTCINIIDREVIQLREAHKQAHASFKRTKKAYRWWSKANRLRLRRMDRNHGVMYRANRLRREGF